MSGSIPNPCWRKWEDLAGDDRSRFCGVCGRDVHAVAAYSEAEWAALMAKGRVCAYSGGVSSRRTVIAGALLTTISPLLAQTGLVRVIVTDSMRTGIGQAEITLLDAEGTTRKMLADAKGLAEFDGLPLGECSVTVQVAGFKLWRSNHFVALTNGVIGAQLELGPILMGTYVMAAREDRPKGRLRVAVTDATGAGVAQAEVRVVDADGETRTMRTDAHGVAQFGDLPLGQRDIKVQSLGFRIWQGKYPVSESEGQLAVSLEVGTVGDYVDVPMVQSSPTRTGAPPPKMRKRWWRRD